jgi:hypothetical protein
MVFGLFDSPRPFKGQEFSKLKKQAQESDHLFIDTEFPPDDKSLFYSKGKLAGVIWKRPKVYFLCLCCNKVTLAFVLLAAICIIPISFFPQVDQALPFENLISAIIHSPRGVFGELITRLLIQKMH